MKKIACLLSLCLCLFVCCKDDVEAVLQVAGDNRPELEKVLSHYRDEPLKLRAARFLIENMDAHYCYGGKAVDGYYHDMDSLFTHKEGDRGFWNTQYDSILNLYGNGMNADVKHRLYDVAHLKSDFLIASIDSAFNVWRRNWNKQYGFDVFCRYVLPYRVGEERPDNWRAEFAMSPGEVADYERYTDNYSYAYNMANTRLQWIRSTIFYPSCFLPDFPLSMLGHLKLGTCKEYAHLCVALLRTADSFGSGFCSAVGQPFLGARMVRCVVGRRGNHSVCTGRTVGRTFRQTQGRPFAQSVPADL